MAEDSADTGSGSVFRLIYRSRLAVQPDQYKPEVANILSAARRKNPDHGITGALVVWDDNVVQTLEGEENVVRDLYEVISRDSRHDQVELVEASPGVDRAFAKWSMAQVTDDHEADMPLRMSQWEGGPDVEGWKALTSPEQDVLIAKMRERVRGASA